MAIEIAPQTPQRLETLISGRGLAVCIAVEILTEPQSGQICWGAFLTPGRPLGPRKTFQNVGGKVPTF